MVFFHGTQCEKSSDMSSLDRMSSTNLLEANDN